MSSQNILVTGGAGYIGSHMVQRLIDAGYTPIVYDNLSTGHKEHIKNAELVIGDIQDENLLTKTFEKYSIAAVMHFAGLIQVNESVRDPEKYYQNNVMGSMHLINAMRKANINKLVFSSTAAVYGNPTTDLIEETHPLAPINPYGRSKFMIESILQDYVRNYDFRFAALRYFNAAGADVEHGLKECHEPETHLIPLVLQAALGERDAITIYGTDYNTPDGSCIRDYIHVKDLCDAHLLALQKLEEENIFICNLGTGVGHSVLEVIKVAEEVSGKEINKIFDERRAGDPAILVADPSKAFNKLHWQPKYSDLKTIISDALNSFNTQKSKVFN